MKDFKKLIKEALTPHYLRESVNEDFTHSSLAITDQSQISGLDDSELLDLLNKVSYEYTPELKDAARIIAQEIEDRNLTNKIHYVDGIRYEFRESVNENLMAKFQDALDDDQFAFFQRALDKADRGEELNQSEEQVVKYFGMVKAKYDDAIKQGMSSDDVTLNPNKPIEEVSRLEVEKLDNRVLLSILDKIDSIGNKNLYGESNMTSPNGNLNLGHVDVDIKREIAIGKVDKNAVKSEVIEGKVNNKLDKLRALRKR